jgi:hypothetical protein
LHPGSIPGEASNKINDLLNQTSKGKKRRQGFVSKARPAQKPSWKARTFGTSARGRFVGRSPMDETPHRAASTARASRGNGAINSKSASTDCGA